MVSAESVGFDATRYTGTMFLTDVDDFLSVSRHTLPGRHPLPYFLAHFDRLAYRPALFDRSGIARPPSIGASVPKRQAEFLAGRLCARVALRHLGKCDADADVGIGSRRAPQWPAGVVGSITHNATHAAACVGDGRALAGLGLDIETRIDAALAAELAHQVAGAVERARMDAAGMPFDALGRLTLLFSAKESFFKAAFPQVNEYFDFDRLELVECDPDQARLRLRCTATLSAGLPAGRIVEAAYAWLDDATVLTAVILD